MVANELHNRKKVLIVFQVKNVFSSWIELALNCCLKSLIFTLQSLYYKFFCPSFSFPIKEYKSELATEAIGICCGGMWFLSLKAFWFSLQKFINMMIAHLTCFKNTPPSTVEAAAGINFLETRCQSIQQREHLKVFCIHVSNGKKIGCIRWLYNDSY